MIFLFWISFYFQHLNIWMLKSVLGYRFSASFWKKCDCWVKSDNDLFLWFIFLKILFFYSWETQRERGRKIGRGRSRLHAGSPMRDLIPGPWVMPWAEGRRSTAETPRGPRFFFLNQEFFLTFFSLYHDEKFLYVGHLRLCLGASATCSQ